MTKKATCFDCNRTFDESEMVFVTSKELFHGNADVKMCKECAESY